jgi:diguanylate cyclase (GGDEF)-like protein
MLHMRQVLVRVLLVLAAILGSMWMGVTWSIHQSENQGLEDVRRETAALALLFATHTDATFRAADLALVEMREQWRDRPADISRSVKAHLNLLGDAVFQLSVVDAKGYVVYASREGGHSSTYVGDREYFQIQSKSPEDRLFVSRPVKSRLTGQWAILLSRPIFERDKFAGVVIISIDPNYFVNFYQKAGLGSGGSARMVRDTGEIMARSSEQEKFVGMVIKPSPYADPGAPLQGSFRRRAQVDGVDRLSSYYRLPQYGLTVVIGPNVQERLAGVRTHQQQIVLAATLVTLLSLGVTGLAIRGVRRSAKTQLALQESEKKFHTLFSSMSDGVALHRLVCDAQGVAQNYEILEVNASFENHTGLLASDVVGKLATDAYGSPQAPFLAEYASVAKTGEPVQFEHYFQPLGKHFLIRAFSPQPEQFATVFEDITKSKIAQSVREADHRQLTLQYQEIVKLQEQLKVQVLRDPLTGLNNRRFMDEALPREIARAKRENYALSFIMLDLDHFKRVNDSYGHALGDVVLSTVAALLRSNAREGDVVCRYGGEEFLVVMPYMGQEQAYTRMEAWRQEIQEMVITHSGTDIRVTISAGIACFPEHGLEFHTLVAKADTALYQSKRDGRNRVTRTTD